MPKYLKRVGGARRRRLCAGALGSVSSCFLLLGIGAESARAAEPSVLDLGAMDQSVDPCADFYTYSCGGWLKQNPIPPDRSSWSVYSKLQDETLGQLKQILEQASKGGAGRAPAAQKIGDYYAARLDEPAIEKRGVAPLAERLAEVQALASKQAIAGWLGRRLPAAPGGLLFTYSSAQAYEHASDEIAEIDQGGLGLPDRDYYLKKDARSVKLRAAYRAHVEAMLVLAGLTPVAAASGAKTVLRIETALAEASQSRLERRNPDTLYHPMTLPELTKQSPNFDWDVFFRDSGAPPPARLNVASPRFFKGLSRLIQSEDLAAWKQYFAWHVTNARADQLPAAFVNEDFAF